jgi:hypothetical protein
MVTYGVCVVGDENRIGYEGVCVVGDKNRIDTNWDEIGGKFRNAFKNCKPMENVQ